jgi:mono/diheme cytochrome c family protein
MLPVATLAAATVAVGQTAASKGPPLADAPVVLAQAVVKPPADTAVVAVGSAAPAADPAALAATGRRLYTGMCARCHGLNLVATGFGADLRRFPSDDRERFNRVVLEGRQAMPALKSLLKPADLDALWAYLGSVNGWPAR